MKFVLLILCCLLLVGVSLQQCGPGLGNCNGQCFNTATHACVPTENNPNQYQLCPLDFKACGVACFNDTLYSCVSGQLQPAVNTGPGGGGGPCPNNQPMCAGQCYDESKYDCVDRSDTTGSLLCPQGFLSCALACYSPSQYNCLNGVTLVSGAVVGPNPGPPPTGTCGSGLSSCAGQCYSPSAYTCITSATTTALCPCTSPCVCGTGCYNSLSYTCCLISGSPTLVSGTSCPTGIAKVTNNCGTCST